MLCGQAPQNMPYMISKQKTLQKKITSPKTEKFYFSFFDIKTIQIDLKLAQGERELVFRPEKWFLKISGFELRKISKNFQKKLSKIENFCSKFFKNFSFFRCFLTMGASVTTWLTAWAFQNGKSQIRLAARVFWNRPPSPPTAKKNWSKSNFKVLLC